MSSVPAIVAMDAVRQRPSEPLPTKLLAKLCAIAKDVPRIPERGTLTDGDQVQHVMLAADLFDVLRRKLAEKNVWYLPEWTDHHVANGRVGLSFNFTFVDCESGEFHVFRGIRALVIEKSDKGIQSCCTVALKTLLSQIFMISHGEELEAQLPTPDEVNPPDPERKNGSFTANVAGTYTGFLKSIEPAGDFFWVVLGAKKFTCNRDGVAQILQRLVSEGKVHDVHVRGFGQAGWKYVRIEEVLKEGMTGREHEAVVEKNSATGYGPIARRRATEPQASAEAK